MIQKGNGTIHIDGATLTTKTEVDSSSLPTKDISVELASENIIMKDPEVNVEVMEAEGYELQNGEWVEVSGYEYTINVENSTEGVELSFDGLPDGVTLTSQDDGSYTFTSETQVETSTITATADVSGTERDDTIEFDDSMSSIDGGAGYDSLLVEGENIDLSNLSEVVSNVERIDLGQGGDQNISLDISDVLSMTDDNNTLRIDGDSGDKINLDTIKEGDSEGEWTLGGQVIDETGAEYDVYSNDDSTVTLEISTQITVDES